MKQLKTTLMLAFILCFTFNFSLAQNKRYVVHQDNVKPSMVGEYEKITKEFVEACKTHNAQTNWITATIDDFRYMYVTPIENMADLDKNPYTDMAKAMGDDFGDIFKRFNKCYDSHSDYVITMVDELTYMPEGITQTQEGENYRRYIYLYHTPENQANLIEGMKGIKALFESKGSKLYYRVYHSGFGTSESYYEVAISYKDEIDAATKSKANDELLGDDRYEAFANLMKYVSRFEEYSGAMRPDLAYSQKKE